MTFETMFFGHSMLVPDIHNAKPIDLSIVSSLLHFAWRCWCYSRGKGIFCQGRERHFHPMPLLHGPCSSSLGHACSAKLSALLSGLGHRGLNPSDVESSSSRVISCDIYLGSMSLKASVSNPNGSQPIASLTFVKRSPLMVPLNFTLMRCLRIESHVYLSPAAGSGSFIWTHLLNTICWLVSVGCCWVQACIRWFLMQS